MFKSAASAILALSLTACLSQAQEVQEIQAEAAAPPQITMGNGESNAIIMDGLSLVEGETTFSQVRVDGDTVKSFRATSTAISIPEVTIANNGWVVLHPVIDGRPDGDMVAGFTYVSAGQNTDVTIQVDHPADPGDKFLVMLHSDVDEDRVFDFVFVEDGINVEDSAVFEGTHMIAHVFAVPE
ncbi:MAG: hypothetical protein ABJH52_11470 [Henriciella sp.]